MHRLLFLFLRAKLLSLALPDSSSPLLREVDWYFGQDNLDDPEAPMFAVPACYIEFLPADFARQSGGGQLLRQQFRLHLVTQVGSYDQVTQAINGPMAHHELLDYLYISIQGLGAKASDLPELADLVNTTDDFVLMNQINRTGIEPGYDGTMLLKTSLTFEALCFDPAAIKNYQTISARLVVTR